MYVINPKNRKMRLQKHFTRLKSSVGENERFEVGANTFSKMNLWGFKRKKRFHLKFQPWLIIYRFILLTFDFCMLFDLERNLQKIIMKIENWIHRLQCTLLNHKTFLLWEITFLRLTCVLPITCRFYNYLKYYSNSDIKFNCIDLLKSVSSLLFPSSFIE